MAITLTNDTLKFRESTSDPWERLLIQANINFNLIYPVGSIYMSTVNVDPGTIFGGTWERLKDKFLLGAGDTYTAGDTGGEATHKLTVDEMPSHTHSLKGGSSSSLNDYFGGSTADYGIYSGGTSQPGDNITNTGGGSSHNNMPPYLVVYMWRRLTLSPTVYTPPTNVLIGEVASEDIVPVSKGGTGASNAADAITNLGFDSGTGYCKMPDGTLICWGEENSGAIPANSYTSVVVTFPVSFISPPTVTCVTKYPATVAARYFQSAIYSVTATYTELTAVNTYTSAVTAGTHFINWMAIGRWK